MHQKNVGSKYKHIVNVKDFDSFRQIGDVPSDNVVNHLMLNGGAPELYKVFKAKTWEDIQDFKISNQLLQEFLFQDNHLPDWADRHKMNQASSLFRSNGNEFLFMLGIVSLPYCYAAAKGAKALYHSEKIRKNTELRLLDTTAFIIDIMKENAFNKDGQGFLVVKQVRLRHAIARFHLKKTQAIQQLNEMPVNQEDMAGTNLAFSYVAIKAMPLIGFHIPNEIQNDYLHFWGIIGYLLGLEKNLLAMDLKTAFWLEKKIAIRQFKPSFEGRHLTHQLVDHYKEQIPNKMTILMIKPLMRHLLGEDVARMIGLKNNLMPNPLDKIMLLLPIFKKYIFPPVQSFELITEQITLRQKQFAQT